MIVFEFIILGLATWRLSHMLVHEAGPFDVFETTRFRLSQGTDALRLQAHQLLSCIYCTSVWIAALLVGLQTITPVLLQILALSAVAVLLERLSRYNSA